MKKITLEVNESEYEEIKGILRKREPKDILVPESVGIEPECGDWDKLGIVFPDSSGVLFTDRGNIRIQKNLPICHIPCKLIPVDVKDLKVGYTYFRTDMDNPDFSNITAYCKYLGNWNYVYPGLCYGVWIPYVVKGQFKYWYQVVPV